MHFIYKYDTAICVQNHATPGSRGPPAVERLMPPGEGSQAPLSPLEIGFDAVGLTMRDFVLTFCFTCAQPNELQSGT